MGAARFQKCEHQQKLFNFRLQLKRMGKYGPTTEIHEKAMHILWGPVINFSIILAMYSYRRYAMILHAIISTFVTIFSLIISLEILVYIGGFVPKTNKHYDHECIGFTAMLLVMIQVILGIVMKAFNCFNFSSNLIHILSITHRLLGYALTVLCKVNYYRELKREENPDAYYGLLFMDIVTAALILGRKYFFPKLEHYPPSKLVTGIRPEVRSLKELGSDKGHIIFSNHIYEAEALWCFHPVGLQVVRSVVNRDVDRYLYGMYSSEKHPELGPHSHSFRSLKLLNAPVAKLAIPQTFPNMKVEFPVSVASIACLSAGGQLYELKLKCLDGSSLFEGYTDLSQLGRFRSLMLNDEVTRLYTNVYFTLNANTKLMEEIFPEELSYLEDHFKNRLHRQEFTEVNMEDLSENTSQSIPMVFKRYRSGKLTNALTENVLNSKKMALSLSQEKGLGLQLRELPEGRVIIVAGGTGLLPFSDLIDLLFKAEYAQSRPEFRKKFCEVSPLLSAPFLPKNSFRLFAAFESLDDVHKLTLLQLAFLASSKRVEVTLRLSRPASEEAQKKLSFRFVKDRFEQLLERELGGESLAKVWVCGPPSMNEGLTKFLGSRLDQSQFLIL